MWIWAMSATIFLLKKIGSSGTSLVVQRLELCVPMQGAQVQSLVGELDPACCNLDPA